MSPTRCTPPASARYYGWTKAVGINDDYESLSFLFDRLLGEQSPSVTKLDAVATQRVPAQRPFPLDKIYPAMNDESRNSPEFGTRTEAFGTSDVGFAPNAALPPLADGTAARFDFADFGAEGVAGAPIAYALPSIAYIAIKEQPAATLTITGSFSPGQGTVQMTDAAGAHDLPVTSWQPTQITATLAANGPAFGQVQALSDTGVASNSVPITQWSGSLAGTQTATFGSVGGQGGTGGGQILTSFTVNFRADVHPTVQVIDTDPVPQNFAFNGVESNSSAQVTSITGSFTTSDGKHTATFGLSPTAGTMAVALPPFSNSFDLGPVIGQPATCNNGMQGPAQQSGAANFFCPGIGYDAPFAGTCVDDGSGPCEDASWNATGAFSSPSSPGDGLLIFQMDPTTYAVTVSNVGASSPGHIFESNDENVTGGVTGTINAPVNAPTNSTTSAHSRRTR